jgi:hypothetical protein
VASPTGTDAFGGYKFRAIPIYLVAPTYIRAA